MEIVVDVERNGSETFDIVVLLLHEDVDLGCREGPNVEDEAEGKSSSEGGAIPSSV